MSTIRAQSMKPSSIYILLGLLILIIALRSMLYDLSYLVNCNHQDSDEKDTKQLTNNEASTSTQTEAKLSEARHAVITAALESDGPLDGDDSNSNKFYNEESKLLKYLDDMLPSDINNKKMLRKGSRGASAFDIAVKITGLLNRPVNVTRRRFVLEEAIKNGYKERGGGLNSTDRALLAKYYERANSIFEWGIGESTEIAAYTLVPKYTGVDSSIEWIEEVRKKSPPHFKFHLADVGELKYFGKPKSFHDKSYQYQTAAIALEPNAFDVYLVDGRYRIACVVIAMLHAGSKGAKPGEFFVIVHDYDFRRRGYHILEKYTKLVEKQSKFGVFTRNEKVSDSDLFKLWYLAMNQSGYVENIVFPKKLRM